MTEQWTDPVTDSVPDGSLADPLRSALPTEPPRRFGVGGQGARHARPPVPSPVPRPAPAAAGPLNGADHAPNGLPANGHASNGASNGHASNGHVPNGHVPNGPAWQRPSADDPLGLGTAPLSAPPRHAAPPRPSAPQAAPVVDAPVQSQARLLPTPSLSTPTPPQPSPAPLVPPGQLPAFPVASGPVYRQPPAPVPVGSVGVVGSPHPPVAARGGSPPEPPNGPRSHRREPDPRPPRPQRSFARELPFLVVVAIVLAFLIKTFLLQAFYIPSGSMERTLLVGDRVLVNKLVYDFRSPHRGEIVVFDGSKACNGNSIGADPTKSCTWGSVQTESLAEPSSSLGRAVRKIQGWVGLNSSNDHDFIKRVIAVGGDTVSCPATPDNPDYCAHVVVNGVALDEHSYVYDDDNKVFAPVKVPRGDLWVMGDHRGNSSDSRYNGTVSVDSVVGRAFVTVWPVSRFGGHSVPSDFRHAFPQQAAAVGLPPVAGTLLALPFTLVARRRRRARAAS